MNTILSATGLTGQIQAIETMLNYLYRWKDVLRFKNIAHLTVSSAVSVQPLMKLRTKPSIVLLVILCQATLSRGDQEAPNRSYVTASKYGQFYAKSIPHERYGLKGITRIYQVDEAEDILIQTCDWYSPKMFLEGFTGSHEVYVVQMGPWHRGHKALAEHHAIAFYKNDKLLRKYSTLDLVEAEDKVSRSVSHYTIFSNIHGFRRPFGNQLVFDVENHEGAILSFDAETGGLLTSEEEALRKKLYEAGVKIGQLKWRWYEGNKEKIPAINDVVITEDVLRRFAQEDFPNLPEGYRYMPDTMWKPARFEKMQEESIDYIGSFSNLRVTDSGHIYVHELWLWRHSGDVLGLYLNVQGLEGGGIPAQIHKIKSASLSSDGAFSFETKWYSFYGHYDASCAQGKLRQGSEVIWGDIEGSDEISFCSGSNVRDIENPLESFRSIEDWHQWADALPGIQ